MNISSRPVPAWRVSQVWECVELSEVVNVLGAMLVPAAEAALLTR